MNCPQAKQQLSAYFDDELPGEERALVDLHVRACPSCAKDLESFRELSVLSHRSAREGPPEELWRRIAAQLEGTTTVAEPGRRGFAGTVFTRRSGLAGVVLAAAAAVLLAFVWWGGLGGRHFDEEAADAAFGRYLAEFQRDPRAAQRQLLAVFNGQPLDPQRAERAVGYRPAIAAGPPPGYAIESVHVMTTPCCKCVQCVCKRDDGSMLVIFEHGFAQSSQCGEEDSQACADCSQGRCVMCRAGEGVATTSRGDGRQMTVVGARDAEEIERLNAWFSNPPQT